MLNIDHHLAPRLRMTGAITVLTSIRFYCVDRDKLTFPSYHSDIIQRQAKKLSFLVKIK
jgi:hypothetical protein